MNEACAICGKEFDETSRIKNDTGVCSLCYQELATDPKSCFGKQFEDEPLADKEDENCSSCPDFAACVKWPKNDVIWEEIEKEKKKMGTKAKTKTEKTATATQTKKKKATKPKPNVKPPAAKGKGKAKAAAKEAKGQFNEYGPLKFREGTSIDAAAKIILGQKSIKFGDAVAALEKTGLKSSNYQSRIQMVAHMMKKVDLIKIDKDNGEITYTKL